MRIWCLIAGLALGLPAWAAGKPLSLDQVLAYADQAHPDLDAAQAETDLARASQLLAESQNDFRVTLTGSLATGHNPMFNGYADDNFASLDARKLLWDGGRTGLARDAAVLETEGRQEQYMDALAQRRLALMTRFFDVLLTDMQYAVDSELAAVAYVNFDNGRDRLKVGDISSVTLAEMDARYQDIRVKREDDLRQARVKRALLASAMNQPGQLPSDLVEPEIKGNDRPLPELNDLMAAMETGNPRLQAQMKLLAAAQKRLEAQRAGTRPSLELQAGTATYSRDSSTRDNVHFGLNLSWPLYQGRQDDARIAQEQARFQLLQAQAQRLDLDLQQALRDTYETIEYLRGAARQAAEVNSAYRDQSLERARAEYELELKTNLGTGMAEIQAARLRRKSVDYQLALAWEKLNGLLGQPVETVKPVKAREETK
jgi:outer membrane protein TolC